MVTHDISHTHICGCFKQNRFELVHCIDHDAAGPICLKWTFREIVCFVCDCVCLLTERQEGVLGVHEQQHSPEQVLVHDVGLDVVRVVLHAEG